MVDRKTADESGGIAAHNRRFFDESAHRDLTPNGHVTKFSLQTNFIVDHFKEST